MLRSLFRPFLLIALLTALLGLVLPYQVGIQAERGLRDQLRDVPGASIELLDKGIYRSHYRLTLAIPDSDAPLILDLSVRHGPAWFEGPAWLVVVAQADPQSPVQVQRWSKKPLQARLRLGLLGSWALSDDHPASVGDHFSLTYDPRTNHLRGTVDVEGVRIRTPSQQILLGRSHVDADVVFGTRGRWLGELGIDVHRAGVLRGAYRWLADGLQLRVRQGVGSRPSLRDIDGSFSLASLRPVNVSPFVGSADRKAARPSAGNGPSLGPYSFIFAAADARANLLPTLVQVLRAAVRDETPPRPERAASGKIWSRWLRQVRDTSLPDLIQALSPADVQIASLGLVWPDRSLHFHGHLTGPEYHGRRAAGWQAEGRLTVQPDGKGSAWPQPFRSAWMALRAEHGSRVGELRLKDGDWRINGRRVDVQGWLDGR
jgi:hypothetical protein